MLSPDERPALSALPPPREPALEGEPAFAEALLAWQRSDGRIPFPHLEGVGVEVTARWLFRWWARQPAVEPVGAQLVVAAPEHLTDLKPLPGLLDALGEGWLAVGAGWSEPLLEALQAATRGRPVRLLFAAPEATRRHGEGLRQALLAWDEVHVVALDPALRRVRSALLQHARSGSVVLVSGPSGSGKRSLVEWARLRCGAPPALRIHHGSVDAPRGGDPWWIFEELSALSAAQVDRVRERLHPSGSRPALGPARPAPPRPDEGFTRSLGESAALRHTLSRAARLARNPTLGVLLLGERGVGKENLARDLHDASPRRRGPFVALDLGTLAPSLLEGELFGWVKGAFSGASGPHRGVFERADGGTLLLDEIGSLPVSGQQKLLRVLQERRVKPLGATAERAVDVRVLAATNRDLDAMVRHGDFIPDLLDRLRGAALILPPLRERAADILPLAGHFAEEARARMGLDAVTLTEEAAEALVAWPWPGNVRELRQVIEAAVTESDDGVVTAGLLSVAAPTDAPVPCFLTCSLSPEQRDAAWPTDPALTQALSELTVSVPPLRHRGRRAVQAAVLHACGARPIHPGALRVLCAARWGGNHRQLTRALAALRGGTGWIRPEALRALPGLSLEPSGAPIRLMLYPTPQPDGSIRGLSSTHDAHAVLVGRGLFDDPTLETLQALADDDPRLRVRLEAIRALTEAGDLAMVSLDQILELSRPHFLIRRAEGELEVCRLPQTGQRRLLVRGLHEETPHALEAGHRACVGDAAELRLESRRGRTLLHLYAFLGEVALSRAMLAGHRPAEAAPPTVEHTGAVDVAPTPSLSRRYRALTPSERDFLNDLVRGHLDAGTLAFGTALRLALAQAAPDLPSPWLQHYLSERPTQNCGRLYAYDRLLREELLHDTPDPGALLERLRALPLALREPIAEAIAQRRQAPT
ncbi:MAG: sigma-54-dependent Fis family transcriptional regulator [Alphaproteobacteria bacterium]|nr:sigma-54-dependent Fis family transcriptional regulator [Alphaproteobacteria bacterium]